jgi:hypothetical protein
MQDDSWHQTAADNPEWLRLFRQAHGIETKGMVLDSRVDLNEDLGVADLTVGDLSFDHFFEPEDSTIMTQPLTEAEYAAAVAATTQPGFGMEGAFGFPQAMSMPKGLSAVAPTMPQPSVDLMDLNCLFADCRDSSTAPPTTTGA